MFCRPPRARVNELSLLVFSTAIERRRREGGSSFHSPFEERKHVMPKENPSHLPRSVMHGRAHGFGKRKRRKEVATYGKLGYGGGGGCGRRAGNEERDLPFKGKEGAGGPEHFGLSKLVIFERLLRLRNAWIEQSAPLPSLFPSPKRGCFVRPSVSNGHTPSSPSCSILSRQHPCEKWNHGGKREGEALNGRESYAQRIVAHQPLSLLLPLLPHQV